MGQPDDSNKSLNLSAADTAKALLIAVGILGTGHRLITTQLEDSHVEMNFLQNYFSEMEILLRLLEQGGDLIQVGLDRAHIRLEAVIDDTDL